MNLYTKLSSQGLKKNKNIYVPYILIFSFLVMSFTSLISLTVMPEIKNEYGLSHVQSLLGMGCLVLFIFSCIFLSYCDGFLMQKRSDEYGLYGVLGLDKKQILKVVYLDSLQNFIIGLGIGLLFSILFYKLEAALLIRIIKIDLSDKFIPSFEPIIKSILIFCGIELFILINRTWTIKRLKNLELIKAKRSHKKGGNKVLSAVLSTGVIGAGYYMALTVDNPLKSLQVFFFAVLLVVLGTFLGFSAITEVIIKALKKNKNFYYKPSHFTSISGIAHRINQNANGLASITIMSCAAIVLLGSSFALYWSGDKILKDLFPRDVIVTMDHELNSKEEIESIKLQIDNVIKNKGFIKTNEFKIDYKDELMGLEGNNLKVVEGFGEDIFSVVFIEDKGLKDNEAKIYSKINFPDELNINNREYKVIAKQPEYKELSSINKMSIINSAVIGVRNLDDLNLKSSIRKLEMFDIDSDALMAYKEISSVIPKTVELTGYSMMKDEFNSLFGTLIFVGTFLGIVFIFGTALIIYYKQIQEGHESKENFNIMRRVGMTENEIKKSIKSQVWTVFFLPPIVTFIHISVAFILINELLKIVGMTNTLDKLIAFLIVFIIYLVIYFVVYKLTSKTYYKIISEN